MSSDEGRERAWEDQTIWVDHQVGEGASVWRLHRLMCPACNEHGGVYREGAVEAGGAHLPASCSVWGDWSLVTLKV